MKDIVSEQKPESSAKDCLRKNKQTSNLLLINSLDNEIHDRKLKMLTLFTNLNESNILQVYFAKTARTVFGIPLFNFSFEL